MADGSFFRLDRAALAELLESEQGDVAKDLARRAVAVTSAAKEGWPVDEGRLRSSTTWQLGHDARGLVARVGTPVEYALVVHEGRRPGQRPPPSAAIAGWLRRNGADPRLAFVVARAIGQRGTRPHPALRDALRFA